MSRIEKKTKPDRMTFFERAVVFRVARGYFFLMAVAAVLLFIGGVVVGARGLGTVNLPAAPTPPPPPQREAISYAEVAAELQRILDEAQNASRASATIKPSGKSSPDGEPKVDPALSDASKALQAVFPDPPYSWLDETEQFCAAPTAFGCLQTGTRVKRHGVASQISAALASVKDEEVLEYVNLLTRVLRQAPVEKRLQLVSVTISLEQKARRRQQRLEDDFESKQKELKEAHDTAVDLARAERERWRTMGLYGVGAGFSLLIVVSLFLAFLSMERHTRALEKLASSPFFNFAQSPRGGPIGDD